MIRTVVLRHEDGRTVTIETAMNAAFLERMYPGWRVEIDPSLDGELIDLAD